MWSGCINKVPFQSYLRARSVSCSRDLFVVLRRHYFPFWTKWINESPAAGPLLINHIAKYCVKFHMTLACAGTTRESAGIRIHVPWAYWHLVNLPSFGRHYQQAAASLSWRGLFWWSRASEPTVRTQGTLPAHVTAVWLIGWRRCV